MLKRAPFLVAAVATTVVVGCGGGGGGGSNPDAIENKVSPSGTQEVVAGRSIQADARSKARREHIQAMEWFVEPVDAPASAAAPILSNPDCVAASFQFEDNLGTGKCTTTVVVPPNAVPSKWRLSNMATNAAGQSKLDSFVLSVLYPPMEDFTVFLPTVPLTYALGDLVTIAASAGFNLYTTVTNVRYSWKQLVGPELVVAGTDSATVSFYPPAAGQYVLEATVSALVDGRLESRSAVVVLEVRDPAIEHMVVSAGDAQVAYPNEPVILLGEVSFPEGADAPPVTYHWEQVSGPIVFISNAHAQQASFIPALTGNYAFRLTASGVLFGQSVSRTAATEVRVIDAPVEAPVEPAS